MGDRGCVSSSSCWMGESGFRSNLESPSESGSGSELNSRSRAKLGNGLAVGVGGEAEAVGTGASCPESWQGGLPSIPAFVGSAVGKSRERSTKNYPSSFNFQPSSHGQVRT